MRLFSHRDRPVHLGPHPAERLQRLAPDATPHGWTGQTLVLPAEDALPGSQSVVNGFTRYQELFDAARNGEPAPERAPIPGDPDEIAANLTAGCYFLDADAAATCLVPAEAWSESSPRGMESHRWAVVVLVEFSHGVEPGSPGDTWILGSQQAAADLRATELAVITAGYIRNLGYEATAHTAGASEVDLGRVALQSGLVEIRNDELRSPWSKRGFGLGVVTTNLEVTPDAPLAPRSWFDQLRSHGPRWWFGIGGTRPGWKRLRGEHRPLHMGNYPMEHVRRVDEATTLVIDEEIPRVPQRASFFDRPIHGDLGPKFVEDRKVFAFKTPSAQAYLSMIRSMVPHQDGPVAEQTAPNTQDPNANALAVKALAHLLGGDMVGICKVPDHAWYSHDANGDAIEPYNENAIVILLDQGYETMEGASGDDWISGSQSMRAYMRGAEIAGVIAEHLRSLGWSARSQTNALSHVLHIPLVLDAGLGELSRIGELVLNPFVGPRFKSVVVTTDLPLTSDRHIDFGLQDFCGKCTKCARECPCGAISFGDKVMFNGYEMWKPDAEKCAKYRLGNLKGSACGRCMKTCPYNTEGLLSQRLWLWAAIRLPFMRRSIARWDDRVGNGSINLIKKWWWDLEFIDGKTVEPSKGTNRREIDLDGGRFASKQKIPMYFADQNPPPNAVGIPIKPNRKEAVQRGAEAESPAAARLRVNR